MKKVAFEGVGLKGDHANKSLKNVRLCIGDKFTDCFLDSKFSISEKPS